MFDNKMECSLQLTTEQVYELGKQLKIRLQENNNQDIRIEYRKFLRKMRGFGLITMGQRDYLAGIILKQNSDCIEFFQCVRIKKVQIKQEGNKMENRTKVPVWHEEEWEEGEENITVWDVLGAVSVMAIPIVLMFIAALFDL